MQNITFGIEHIKEIMKKEQVKNLFLVCGKSMEKLVINEYLNQLSELEHISITKFSDFQPNPVVESVEEGVVRFQAEGCDFVMAVGGGSAMDVAKCIKQRINNAVGMRKIKMLAIPTTAGTGSESTQFAVVYVNSEKTSVDDERILPEYVILDEKLLQGLPSYHRKSTLMDAFCQAIESVWAVQATKESQELASQAICIIMDNWKEYISDCEAGDEVVARNILRAANLAGQAINITRTTAAHAMSYKITSLFDVTHGHAVAICLSEIWSWMMEHMDVFQNNEKLCSDFQMITKSMGCKYMEEALNKYRHILKEMHFSKVILKDNNQLKILVDSVNEQRLGNHPVKLTKIDLKNIYERILR